MNIRPITSVSFGAIRIPLGSASPNKKAIEVIDKIHAEFHPNGISAPDYNAMFFKNKTHEAIAEKYLAATGVPYRRVALADICDQDTRFEWATTGDETVLYNWYNRTYNK